MFLLVCGFCNYANAIEMISVNLNGEPRHGKKTALSQDGNVVAFSSLSTDLVLGYHTAGEFVRDRLASTTYKIDIDSQGNETGNPESASHVYISDNGRVAVFHSNETALSPNDTNNQVDVFVHDRDSGVTERVSVNSFGNQAAEGGFIPTISANGRFVLFHSESDDLVVGSIDIYRHIFVHDRQTKQTTRVSVDSLGNQGNGHSNSGNHGISGDGRWVVISSFATNLVPGDTNGFQDIFLHDRQTGQTRRINTPTGGGQTNGESSKPSISKDAKFVSYSSTASNLVPGDVNNRPDIFTYDVSSGTTTRLNTDSFAANTGISTLSGSLSQSRDGQYMILLGQAQNTSHVLLHDRNTGETALVSANDDNVPGNANTLGGTISADGSTISFSSFATNLTNQVTSGLHTYVSENPLLRSNIEYDISLSEGINLNTESGGGFVISNDGSAHSAPFRVKVCWSIDDTFDDTDLHELSAVINTVSVDQPELVSLDFKMPMPNDDNPAVPLLSGSDRLSPSEWIGQPIYARACIMDVTGLIELKCKIEQVKVLPPTPDALQASNGIGTDLIELSWPVPPTDNGQLLADSFRFEELSDGVSREIEAKIEDMQVVTINDKPHYLLKLRNRTRGKRLDYARHKACLDTEAGETVCSTWAEGESIGNSIGDALASTDLRGKIRIDWATFGLADQGYFLTRCEAGSTETCIDIGRNYRSNTHSTETALEQGHLAYFINNTSFVDTEVERDKTYVYTVKVCDVSNGTNCQAIYPFRLSNQGQSNLIDGFEDDDNFATAQEIHRSINQLHSFDTKDDQDWFKLIIDRPQAVQMITSGPLSYDTEITLYNAQNQQIDYNDDAATTFAELTTPELAVGEYFIKVNQKVDPDPFFYRPVPNYNFKVKMKSIVITPIIMLLLDDG